MGEILTFGGPNRGPVVAARKTTDLVGNSDGSDGVTTCLILFLWLKSRPVISNSRRPNQRSPDSAQTNIVWGNVRPGASIITRPAPGIPPNPGGGIEAVINPGDFVIQWFVMP